MAIPHLNDGASDFAEGMRVILVSFLFFGVAWTALNCECGKRNAGRIVGGKESKKNEYTWMVALQKAKDASTKCGGTIVTPWHVVTAAHCVKKHQAQELVLVVGAHDVNDLMDPNAQRLSVEQIIIHPYYNTTTKVADVAILVTSTEIIFNQFVGPACMPSGMLLDEMIGKMVKAMGWGRHDPSQPNTDKIKKLREVDLEIQSVSACNGAYGQKICTYTPGKDTCTGDSGGPVVWLDPDNNRYTLVGVVSTGPTDCGNSESPGKNTNVAYYKGWINMRIRYSKSDAKICH